MIGNMQAIKKQTIKRLPSEIFSDRQHGLNLVDLNGITLFERIGGKIVCFVSVW